MTGRLALWLAAALLCAAAWALTGTEAAAAVLAGVILLPAGSILLARLAAGRIRTAFSTPLELQKGLRARGRMDVINGSWIPAARVQATVKIRNELTGESELMELSCSVPPRRTRGVEYEFLSSHCGRFSFSLARLVVFDWFGIAGWRRSSAFDENRVILPETFPMSVRIAERESPQGDDTISLNRKGDDRTEIFQLRDYAEGDSVKQIHWKLSQKYDKLIVSDPSASQERVLLVAWDKSAPASPDATDALAEAVMSFCLTLVENEIPYSIALDSQESAASDITSEEELYDAVGRLLRTEENECGSRGLEQLLSAQHYPIVALFTAQPPENLARLSSGSRVTVFLCGESGEGSPEGVNSIVFSPGDYKSVLRDVTV